MFLNILHLFFPSRCAGCYSLISDNEIVICSKCRNDLPIIEKSLFDIPFKRKLFGAENSSIKSFSSLFNFEKGTEIQEIIHNLKYKKHQYLGEFLGSWHGNFLKNSDDFKAIDIVIPIPIHKKRLKKRSYNQMELYGKTIAKHLEANYREDILKKNRHNKSQVFLKREERFQNIFNSMFLKNIDDLNGKHILIVDDLITTGATMQACIRILKNASCKISIASIAIALGEGM